MLSKIIHETKTNDNILKILWQRARRQPACVLHDPCVWTGVTKLPPLCWTWVRLWMSTDSRINLSFLTSNTDASGAIQCYNITSKTHSHIPLVALVSCQIGQSIPHLFYCCLIDFPPPRTALSTARTFVWCIVIFNQLQKKLASQSVFQGQKWHGRQYLSENSPSSPSPQLSLDLLLLSNLPCTSRGEHSPSWHTAVLSQRQSHTEKAKHGHWLTRTVFRGCQTLLCHSFPQGACGL